VRSRYGLALVLLAATLCRAQDGRVFAILIGISKYRDQGIEWLKFADRDARAFADHLRSERGGSLSNVELFVDQDATRAKVNDTLEKVLQTYAGARDTVYIFVSARGFATADSEEGYISTFDSPDEKQSQYMLRVSEFRKHLEASHAGRIVLFADVCRESERIVDNRINLRLEKLQQMRRPIEGLLASQAKNPSREAAALEGGHGVFSFFLVNGLQARASFEGTTVDSDKDGMVSFSEIVEYLRRQMKPGYKQDPQDFGEKNARGFPLSDLKKKGVASARPRFRRGDLLAWNGREWPSAPGWLFYTGQAQAESLYDQLTLRLKEGNLLGPGGAVELLNRLRLQVAAGTWEGERDKVAAALEDRGDQIISRDGIGDRFPDDPGWVSMQMTATEFNTGELFFGAANQLRPRPALEARRLYCRGRSLMLGVAPPLPAAPSATPPPSRAPQTTGRTAGRTELESAIQLDGEFPEAQNSLGIVHLQGSDFPAAIGYFKKAHQQATRWAYPRINLALAYTEGGDYLAAEREYREAIRSTPYYPYLYINLAVLLQKVGRRRDAAREYQNVLLVFQHQEAEFRRRADAWRSAGNPAEAADAEAHANLLRRNVSEAYNGLGTIRHAEKHYQAAAGFYEQALLEMLKVSDPRDSDLAPARHNLASLYENTATQPERAVALWEENLKWDPAFLPSRLALAKAYMRRQKPGEAERNYRLAVQQAPGNIEAIEGLGRALAGLGRLDEARTLLESGIRDHSYPSAVLLEALGDIERARRNEAAACEQFLAAQAALRGMPSPNKALRDKLRSCKVKGSPGKASK
jgi:tetratricopeptide (TPR) repeat protein